MAIWLILIGVALIDAKLWKLMLEQNRHNKAVEALLTDMRDGRGSSAS